MAQLVTIKVAQLVTFKNGHFLQILAFEMCWNTYFYSVFEHQPKIAQNGPKKAMTFDILQNTGS